jgi:hypothetical protein
MLREQRLALAFLGIERGLRARLRDGALRPGREQQQQAQRITLHPASSRSDCFCGEAYACVGAKGSVALFIIGLFEGRGHRTDQNAA